MSTKKLTLLLLSCFFFTMSQAQIHISLEGNDNNSGTEKAPLLTIHKAVEVCQPGDTIWVHGGNYIISERIKIPEKQTSAKKRCYLWAVPGEKVVIDGSAMNHKEMADFKMGRCIYVNHLANYWHFKGLELCNAEDNGMKIEGSYNIIENCVFHDNNDTGLQIGMYKDFAIEETKELPAGEPKFNPGYQFCCGNIVINCDSYNNYDARTYNGTDDGGDADGFACKLFPGPGTEFHGCRAWDNSDDNWDLYMVYHPVVIDSCWSYHAGYNWRNGEAVGNGNGFKLGGGGSAGGSAFDQSIGAHVVTNCVSFGNYKKGFDQNNAYEGMYIFNCTAWDNDFNYRFPTLFKYGGMMIRNCIGFKARTLNHEFLSEDKEGSVVPDTEYNSWTTLDGCSPYKEGQKVGKEKPMTKDYSDQFISLSVEDFKAPREADGSLPKNNFARLKENAIFKDLGCEIIQFEPKCFITDEEAAKVGLDPVTADFVTIHYNDNAPDFGAFELEGEPADIDDSPIVKASLDCLTGNQNQEVITGNAITEIKYEMENAKSFSISKLPEGLSYSVDGNFISIFGTPTEDGAFEIIVEGDRNTVKRNGSVKIIPLSHVLTGDWYHFQDDITSLPEELKNVIATVNGTDSSHPSSIQKDYTESGSVPAGCTQGAVVMGRNNGGLEVNTETGLLKLLVNLHFTGGRYLKIEWTLDDGTTDSFTTSKITKGTYTSWNPLEEAGIADKASRIRKVKILNANSSGEIRMYDIFIQVLDTTTGINNLIKKEPTTSNILYNITGQRVNSNYKGVVLEKGKKGIKR